MKTKEILDVQKMDLIEIKEKYPCTKCKSGYLKYEIYRKDKTLYCAIECSCGFTTYPRGDIEKLKFEWLKINNYLGDGDRI